MSSSSHRRQQLKNKRRLQIILGVAAAIVIGGLIAVLANSLMNRTPPPVSEKVAAAYASGAALATPAPIKAAAPVVMFIGDSYSAGTGATTERLRWTTLLSASKGWTENNVALGGTGYLATAGKNACGREVCENYEKIAHRPASAVPDLIVVSGGRNDGSLLTPELQTAISGTFAKLRLTYPDAEIVATSPILGADAPPPGHAEVVAAVNSAVTGNGGVMLDIGDPFLGHPELITTDWVHPNDAGHKVLADAVGAAFDRSGIKVQP